MTKPVEIPEAVAHALAQVEDWAGTFWHDDGDWTDMELAIATLRREIAKAILLARASVHRAYGSELNAVFLQDQAAALGEEGE